MPTKLGGGHQMQEYDPATGRYGYGSGGFAKNHKMVKNSSTNSTPTEKGGNQKERYKGGSPIRHSLKDNIEKVAEIYGLNENGFFAKIGKKGSDHIRQIDAKDEIIEARKFYEIIAYGGVETTFSNGKGLKTKLKDGTIISYREITSTQSSPAVEINVKRSHEKCGIKTQKIHFERK